MGYIKNFEQFLFYFLFFAIPLQTRKILYSPGWYYNEWQSISIYATDLILLILLIFWAVDKRLRKSFIHRYDYFLLGFLAAAAVSVKNSSDFYVGAVLWLKLAEFALLYFYLKTYAIRPVRGKTPAEGGSSADHALQAGRTSNGIDFVKALYVLLLGGAFQAIIAIGQFLKQGDLGLRWLGESVLGPHMTGIASFLVPSRVEGFVNSGLPAEALAKAGEKVIRAYGTTPHPNILAAYLLLSIFAFYFLYIYQTTDRGSSHKFYDTMIYHKILKYWRAVVYLILLFGLFFTFSRIIIFLWAAGFFARAVLIGVKTGFKEKFWRNPVIKTKLVQIVTVTVLAVVIFSVFYWPEVQSRLSVSSEEEAVRLRVFYNKESLGGGVNLFGIGLGDFTGWLMEQNPNLPSYVYQPVHNIYLLVYSEIGIIGFVLFLLFLIGLLCEFIKKTRLRELKHHSFLLIAVSVLFIGLFDHFLFTLQQGRFIFWLVLTLLAVGDIIKEQ